MQIRGKTYRHQQYTALLVLHLCEATCVLLDWLVLGNAEMLTNLSERNPSGCVWSRYLILTEFCRRKKQVQQVLLWQFLSS